MGLSAGEFVGLYSQLIGCERNLSRGMASDLLFERVTLQSEMRMHCWKTRAEAGNSVQKLLKGFLVEVSSRPVQEAQVHPWSGD